MGLTDMAKPTMLQRVREMLRSYTIAPLGLKSKEISKLWAGVPSSSGVDVNEETALNYAAVFAAVSLIADDISSLPLMLYKKLPNGGKDRYESHPLYRLLHDEPNPEMGTMTFRQTLTAHALLWHGGFAEIVRDGAGRPVRLWPLVPNAVTPFRNPEGALAYRVANPSGGTVVIPAEDMLHLHGLGFDGVTGYSVVSKARETIGLGIAGERFGGAFFGNGSTFGGVISYPNDAPPQTRENNRKALEKRHQGVEKAHQFLTLYGGAKYERLGIPPNDAQFLETRVFQIREIARWFKLPPHKLGDLADATFSNVEQQNLDYYTSCLRPWLELWEQELSRKLISPLERRQQFIEHEVKGLLKADAAARGTFYQTLFNVGSITPNEIRGLENMDPIEGGDQAFVQMNNLVPIGRVDELIDAQIAKGKPAPPVVPEPAPPTQEQINSVIEAMERRLSERDATVIQETERRALAEAAAEASRRDADEKRETVTRLENEIVGLKELRVDLGVENERMKARIVELESESETSAQAGRDAAAKEIMLRDQQRNAAEFEAKAASIIAEKESVLLVERGKAEAAEAARQLKEADLEQAKQALEQAEAREQALLLKQAAAEAVAEELRVRAVSVQELRDALLKAQEATAAAEKALAEGVIEREGIEARAVDLSGRVQASESVIAELRLQVADVPGLREALARVESEKAAALDRGRGTDSRRAELEGVVASQRSALSQVAAAHRALMVDAVERLLQREMDRARKAQATPEKLRAWVQSFYSLHAETCRTALRPVIVAWAAATGADVDATVDRVVRDHLETSRDGLLRAADVDDADDLGASLAVLFKRWETERAHSVADRLMGAGYGH